MANDTQGGKESTPTSARDPLSALVARNPRRSMGGGAQEGELGHLVPRQQPYSLGETQSSALRVYHKMTRADPCFGKLMRQETVARAPYSVVDHVRTSRNESGRGCNIREFVFPQGAQPPRDG